MYNIHIEEFIKKVLDKIIKSNRTFIIKYPKV